MSSIERAPKGRWRARYRDLSGLPHSRIFDGKIDASQHLERIGADMQRGERADPRDYRRIERLRFEFEERRTVLR
ncbi:MAG: hypothetical protein ACK5RL_21470 [Acidimicrobiales bacterium]